MPLSFIKRSIEQKGLAPLLKASSATFIHKILGTLAGFAMTLLVSNYFGPEIYGIHTLTISIVVLLSMVSKLGMDLSILKIIAISVAENKTGGLRKLYQRSAFLVFCVSLVGSAILVFFRYDISVEIFKNQEMADYLGILGASLLPWTILRFNGGVSRGFGKTGEFALFEYSGVNMLFIVSLATLLLAGINGPSVPFWAYTVSCFALLTYSLVSVNKLFSRTGKHEPLPDDMNFKEFLRLSMPLLLGSALVVLLYRVDTLVLAIYRPEAEVGIYNAATKIAAFLGIGASAISSYTAPKLAAFHRLDDKDNEMKLLKRGTLMIAGTTLLPTLIMVLIPDTIMSIFGNEFTTGSMCLVILAIGNMLFHTFFTPIVILQMTGKERHYQNFVLAAVIVNLALNFLLIPDLGMVGAAIGTVVGMMILTILSSFVVLRSIKR